MDTKIAKNIFEQIIRFQLKKFAKELILNYKAMQRPQLPKACYVKNVKGRQLVYMPDGTQILKVVWTRLHDGLDKDLSYVIVKILVNLK